MDFNSQEEVKKQEVQQVVDKARNPPKKAPSALDQIAINDAIANRTVSSLGDNRINLKETGSDADMQAAYTKVGDEYRAKYDTFTRGINNEERAAQNQTGWEQALNGVVKNAFKAGLYALDGVVGFPLGVVKGLSEGSMSAAWDNSFSRKVDELGKHLDVSLPNYMTENEKNMGFLKSLTSGNTNFLANELLGGVAFMVGAIGSEFIWAGLTGGTSLALSAAKAAGKTARAVRSLDDVAHFATNTKKMMADLARNASSASKGANFLHNTRFLITSSGFESAVASRHSLDESLYNFQQAIQAQHGRTPTAEEYGKFMPDAVSQANNVFMANMAILAPSNVIMFGGLFGVNWKLPGILSKAGGRLTGVGMNSVDDAGKILWKEIIPTKTQKFIGYTSSIIKKPLVEGVYEEGFQGVASKASQNYLASKYDPSALKDNYGLIESVRDAFGQMYGTKEGRKEIGIGMLIGALGGSRGSYKAQRALYGNQAPLAEQRNSLNATMDKATNGLLRRMLDVNQLNTAMKKAHQEAAVGNTVTSAMYFDKAQFAKMNMENGAGMLEESVKNFQTMLENSPVSSLAAEYGIPEDSVKDVKGAILEQYVQNAKDYKTAMKAAEALVPTIKDYEKGGKSRDLVQELALNMYLGGKSSERASMLAQSIEEATGQSGIASHLRFFSNVTREAKNSAEAVRVATKRIKMLSDELALLQQEYSTLQETAPRTQENNVNAKKVEANRRKYGKTQQILTERAAELEELKRQSQANPLIQDYAFGDILQNDMVGIDAIANSLDELEKLDSYLIELEKSSPRAARALSHMLSEYANNISAFEQFNIVYNKLSDERFNFKSYKGIAKVFSTKGKYTFAPKNPTPKQELTEEFIRDNNIDEYDAFGLRLLDDLSNKVYSLDVADIEAELLNGDPISLEEWNEFLTNNTVSDEIKADIARKVFEGENLSNREQRIQEANKAEIEDTVKQLKKDKGDSIRKARKPKNAVIDVSLTGAARIRDLISQILASKNYLSQYDVDDVSRADVPTEEEYRELNKLLKAPRLSAKRQARLKELLDKTNRWGEIEGTFSGKHKLGQLYNILFAYEQSSQETVSDETAEIPITETMHEETFEGATRKDNYNHLQVYDKVFFTKDKNGNYYISNLTFNGLLEVLPSYLRVINRNKTFLPGEKINYKEGDVLTVEFDDATKISFSITKRNNIQITEASKEWMNENTNIQISPLSSLPTNYFTVLRRVNGNLVPLPTDIEIVFDIKAVQGLKKGDTVFAQVVKNTFNKDLLTTYNKSTDKTAALVTLAKNLLIQFVDNKNNLMGVLKAEYDLESANSASDFQAVSEFRRDAAQKFLENKDFETIDLEKAVKVLHVYNGHPVLDIRDENGKFVVNYNRFTDATLENIVDAGYIENGKVTLRNNTDRTTDSFVYTIKANKNGKYTNKRVPVVVINFNGLNIVYPVKLIPSVVDNTGEIDAILNKPISNAEKAQQIIEFLIKNKVNASALNIMPDNLTVEKILEIKKTLVAQNKFIDVQEFASKENDMGDTLKENASINIDLKGDMFHSPKVVIELSEETSNEEPLFETAATVMDANEQEAFNKAYEEARTLGLTGQQRDDFIESKQKEYEANNPVAPVPVVEQPIPNEEISVVETRQQIENFGVNKADVEPVHSVISQVFNSLKNTGLTAAQTVGDWVGIGKGSEKSYSLKLDGKDITVKPTSPDVVNGFYSPLEKTINETKVDKLPAKQWIEKYANSEEAKWTGLKDWLTQQQGSVSKADIQNYLKDNRIEIVEVVKGESQTEIIPLSKIKWEIVDEDSELYGDYEYVSSDGKYRVAEYSDGTKVLFNNEDVSISRINSIKEDIEVDKENTDSKFSEYQLEGQKESYKEVLVTMPKKKVKADGFEISETDTVIYEDRGMGKPLKVVKVIPKKFTEASDEASKYIRDNSYKHEYNLDYNDGESVIDALEQSGVKFDKTNFQSSHFDEPNILVHLRMNTRIDVEGNKVLFLEEVQSDWGQQGKKEGFETPEKKAELKKLQDDANTAAQKFNEIEEELNKQYSEKKKEGETRADLRQRDSDFNKLAQEYAPAEQKMFDSRRAFDMFQVENRGEVPTAPFVLDTNAWTKLSLKVALKEAVKQGVDKIAWTTGEQQNNRYDLSKQVDVIDGKRNKDGTYEITATKDDSKIFGKSDMPLKEIEDTFGKDVAKKINDSKSPLINISGDNLKAGGKGMKGFYGSPTEGTLGIVGNVAKSLFKQEPKTVEIKVTEDKFVYDHDSTTIEETEKAYILKDKDGNSLASFSKEVGSKYPPGQVRKQKLLEIARQNPDLREKVTGNSTQHSITITPELKASVEQGQPLFKDAEAQYRIENGKNIVEAIKDFDGSPKATVALTHEIMHPIVVAIIDGAKEGNEIGIKHTNTIKNEFNKANPNNKITTEELIKGNDAFKEGTTTNQYRAVQEFIAKSWEQYHTEGGKGFSEAFQKVLKQITEAFKAVYKLISGSLTPELRQMFDEILGKEETSPEETSPEQQPGTTEVIDINMSEEEAVAIMESIKNNPDTAKNLTNREANILFRKYDAYFSNLNKKADEEFQSNIETIKNLPQAEKTKVLDGINNNRTETMKRRTAYDKLLDSAGLDRFNLGGNVNAPETYHFTSAESVINMLEDNTLSGNEQEDEGYGGISTTTNKDFDNPFFATVKQYGAMFSVVSDFSESAVNIKLDLNALKQDGYTAIKGNENMGTFAGEEEVRIIKKGEGQKARDVSETEINNISKYIKEIILNTEKLTPEEISEIKNLAKEKGVRVSEKQNLVEQVTATESIKSSWESNIEALINPQTGLSAVITKILDAQQPLKDAFLKRIGLSIEEYRNLDENGKQKIQDQWIKSKEFTQASEQPLSPKSRVVFLPNPNSFQDREMHFIDGVWKQKVGKEFTMVSQAIQEQAARIAEENFPALSENEANITTKLINKQC